ncbi:hypothetical protein OUZ56_009498 [Daphnia magna]|uniref:Uncharacterized protein n=1 Tax=Daphnia magna TaxID=35525 RepID=A0ABR0AG52_9CRUS|nr:hypothetical protein OUZ56_009498 [Daphnia magna]
MPHLFPDLFLVISITSAFAPFHLIVTYFFLVDIIVIGAFAISFIMTKNGELVRMCDPKLFHVILVFRGDRNTFQFHRIKNLGVHQLSEHRALVDDKTLNTRVWHPVLGIDHQMAIDDLDLDPTKFLIEMIEIDHDSFLIELIESISISINFKKQFISGFRGRLFASTSFFTTIGISTGSTCSSIFLTDIEFYYLANEGIKLNI